MMKNLKQKGYLNQKKRLKKEMETVELVFLLYRAGNNMQQNGFFKSVYSLGKKLSKKACYEKAKYMPCLVCCQVL